MAMANVRGETGPPSGAMRRSSSMRSAIHFSATGSLFIFFTRPISIVILWRRSSSSLAREVSPGAGSTLMTAQGPETRRCSIFGKKLTKET